MYYSRDKGTYFTSPEIVLAIPTLSESFFLWGVSYIRKKHYLCTTTERTALSYQ